MLCNTGSPAWCSVMTQRGGIGGGEEAQEGGDRCIILAGLCCCAADTNKTLQSNFLPIKKLNKKKEKKREAQK